MEKKKEFECIFFVYRINAKSVSIALEELQRITSESKIPILVLGSEGGGTVDGVYFHDQIKLLFPDIIMVGSGEICSMAVTLFLAAKKENRFITENTSFFLHEVGYSPDKNERKDLSDKDRISFSDKDFKKLPKTVQESLGVDRKRNIKIITRETNLSRKKLKRLERKETWVQPNKIIKYGFASKVIISMDEINFKK